MMQRSIKNITSCSGISLHTGHIVNLLLRPADPDTGIIFVRKDVVGSDNVIHASFKNVSDTGLCTVLSNSSGIYVMTIEHLMASLFAAGIDNLIIEIDGPEIPTFDGSAAYFSDLLSESNIEIQLAPKKIIKILKEVKVEMNDKSISISPHDHLVIDFSISFDNKYIGEQRHIFDSKLHNFKEEISKARTFGFINEIEMLKSKGLAKGASLENAIGVSDNGIMNPEGLRYNDEFVRHKILDCLGDLYLATSQIHGYVKAVKSGHMLNNMLLHEIFKDKANYQI